MNVDTAMEIAEQLSGGSLNFRHHSNLRALAIGALYNEVKRLRAELELSKANVETLKKALFEVQEAAIRLGDQVDDAKAELAAAKAASEVPVRVLGIYDSEHPMDCRVVLRCKDDRTKFRVWLRDRMKDTTPPTA